jgi:hypothetical protein
VVAPSPIARHTAKRIKKSLKTQQETQQEKEKNNLNCWDGSLLGENYKLELLGNMKGNLTP